jgi:hypothetical protein
MSFFNTVSRIIQQGKDMVKDITPASKQTYNKVTPVNNSQFQSNPLLRTTSMQYKAPVIQQPTFNVPVKAQIPQAKTVTAQSSPLQTTETMADVARGIIQGGKQVAVLGKDVIQGTNRAVATAGITAGNVALPGKPFQSEIDPKQGGIFSRAILGDTTVKDLPTYGKAGIRAVNEMTGSNIPEKSRYAIPFAIGGLALDLSGTGKAGKNALAKIASNMTEEDAVILKNLYAEKKGTDVLKDLDKEAPIFRALGIEKKPHVEQRKIVEDLVKEYDKRWGGVDEAINPPVQPNKPGAMDIKKPTPIQSVVTPKKAETPAPGNKKLERFRAGKPSLEAGNIRNPLAKAPEKLPTNNQVVSSGNDSTRLSPIDRLIADNKVRVVSRDGRDVYQVKKGGEWVNKRDEDSAIRAVTPRSPIDTIKAVRTPKIARTGAQYRVTPEQVKDYENRLTALSGAEAGERVVKNNADGTFGGYVAKRSTFPSYIDEDLRSRKLFDKYMEGRQGTAEDFTITYPKGSQLDRLDKIIKARTGVKEIKVRQMSRSRDVERLEREATDLRVRETKRIERQQSPAFRSVLDEPTQLNKERVAQLEKAAMPTADVVRPTTPYKIEPLQDIITKTPLERKVNIIDYLRTPDRVLNKIGFGKEAKLLRDQYEKYSQELPKNIDKISAWVKRVPKDASERIFQHLDGKSVKLSSEEQKVADEIRAYLKDWADRLGLPEENRVANYITRLFDDQLIKQEFDEDLAKIISGKIPGEVYNPFLQKRLGAKGYKQDVWQALDAYTKRATRKVHIDPALERIQEKAGSSLDFTQLEESQFKYIQRYIDRVQMRPTEVDNAIDNAVKQTLGYRFGQRPVTNVSRFLRRMTYRGMLGGNLGSALRNLSQGVNTYAVLGEKYTAIGYAKLLNPASRKELLEQGIFNNNFIEDRVLSSTKKLLQKGDKALWFFFDQAEKTNRGAAYLGAKAKGLGKGMTEQEAIDYAKNIVRKTQFSYDAVDQPVALGSDIMKTLFQFQTYTTKQTEFLTEMIKDRNVVGLLRYGIAGYVFVNTVGKALGMTEAELIPLYQNLTGERKTSLAPSLKFPIELTKATFNTPDRYGNERDLEQKAKDVGKSLIGLIPGGNQIKKTYEGIKANTEGGSFTKAGVKQFEVGQSPAAKVQTALFGKYANQNAKDYFNKKTTTGDKELDKELKNQKKDQATQTNKVTAKATQMMLFTPEEQQAQLKEIAKTDKEFALKVRDKLREENKKKTWSDVDKGIAKLGVENGARANYVYKKMKELPPDQRNAYIKDLHDRKVISADVLKQIKELHKNNGIIE